MAVEKLTYTVAQFQEFESLRENVDRILELIDGEIVEKMPSFTPSRIASRIARFLGNFADEHQLGYVTGEAGGYVMSEGNVFNPDVGYISKERLPEKPEREAPVPPESGRRGQIPNRLKACHATKGGKISCFGDKVGMARIPR